MKPQPRDQDWKCPECGFPGGRSIPHSVRGWNCLARQLEKIPKLEAEIADLKSANADVTARLYQVNNQYAELRCLHREAPLFVSAIDEVGKISMARSSDGEIAGTIDAFEETPCKCPRCVDPAGNS